MTPPPQAALLRAGLVVGFFLITAAQPFLLAIAPALRAAETATAQENYDAAADAMQVAYLRLPYAGYVTYRSALTDISAKRFAAAARKLEITASLEGWNITRRIALGDALLGMDQREAALKQWELARTLEPNDPALLARLAKYYEDLGRYPEAKEALAQLTQLQPENTAALYRLALLTVATAPNDAPARLSLLAELAPNYADTAHRLLNAIQESQATNNIVYSFGRVGFELLQLQEWALAEVALTQAVTLDSNYADAYVYLGLAQDRQQKDGFAAYETAIKLAPTSPLAQFFMGLYYRRVGKPETAIPYLKEANRLDPQNPGIMAEIAGAYASLSDLQQAEAWFVQAVQIAPRTAQFWLLLAQFYVDHDYHVAEAGLPAARQAVSLAPENPAALDALGFALTLTGDLTNGEKMLERAIALNPELASAFYHLGVLYLKQNKTTEATAAWNRALYLDPTGPYGNMALKALSSLTP